MHLPDQTLGMFISVTQEVWFGCFSSTQCHQLAVAKSPLVSDGRCNLEFFLVSTAPGARWGSVLHGKAGIPQSRKYFFSKNHRTTFKIKKKELLQLG